VARPRVVAAVAVTELGAVFRRLAARLLPRRLRPRPVPRASPSLRALTAAAMALPGLAHTLAQAAEGDEASFQYSRYQEGERVLFGVKSKFDPIQVDSLFGSAGLTLFDRVKFLFHYIQDTWSGATPIATAPVDLRGNRPTSPDGVSGATPFIAPGNLLFFDSQFNVLNTDGSGNLTGGINNQLVHTLSSASPETRKQGDFRLGYEWDEAALNVGGGISLENDYESRWGSLNGRRDFNQKLTTLSLGLSYTKSDIETLLDHDTIPYILDVSLNTTPFRIDPAPYREGQIEILGTLGDRTLSGEREDWAAHLGLTQVLSKNALIETGLGFTRSTGFLENPYKVVEVAFIDPEQQSQAPPGGFVGEVHALLERRPDVRNQWTWDARYVHYVEPLNAALHLSYRFYSDDWGIDAHTFEADWGQPLGGGWTITPRIRYYSQEAADFYRPFLISKQAERTAVIDEETRDFIGIIPYDPKKLPANFSSDHRLSGYGALSGGVTVAKEFARGVSIEAGFEYYTHQGGLKLGGGGEGDYADFDYWQANAALRVNLSPMLSVAEGGPGARHASTAFGDPDRGGHAGHADHDHGPHAPAGVMAGHMLPKAGDFMVGYRYMYSLQSGDTLRDSHAATDQAIIAQGCGDDVCRLTPEEMSMHMHMPELMYAPTDWLNLMLMPQFVDMEMTLRDFEGAPPPPEGTAPPHFTRHSTGLIGDTFMWALVKLFDAPGRHLHLGLGLSAPTGEVDLKLRPTHLAPTDEFLHYGMQLGSGTWDLLPSLTYTGEWARWSWGGQVSGIHRLEDRNDSGYALGDQFQATAWGGYGLTDWLSASVRGVYTTQGAITGEFNGQVGHLNRQGPMDFPANYGGRYWDVGFGLSTEVPIGDFTGNRLSVEWLQPVMDDVNGFQLEREGTLVATWSLRF
jgi:hypothetical protein